MLHTLSYTGATLGMDEKGEGRLVVNMNAAKQYTTGTITGITGNPPVVTGSGTTWTSLPGAEAATAYCSNMTSDVVTVNSTFRPWIHIASIGSATSLTLDYTLSGGATTSYLGTKTGNYTIAPCDLLSSYADDGIPGTGQGGTGAGTLTFASFPGGVGSAQWAASDTFEVPVGTNPFTLTGLHVIASPMFPASSNAAYLGMNLTGNGYVPLNYGVYFGGLITNGFDFNNTWGCDSVQQGLGIAPTNCTTRVFQFDHNTPQRLFDYSVDPTATNFLFNFPSGYLKYVSATVDSTFGPYWTWGGKYKRKLFQPPKCSDLSERLSANESILVSDGTRCPERGSKQRYALG